MYMCSFFSSIHSTDQAVSKDCMFDTCIKLQQNNQRWAIVLAMFVCDLFV